MKGGHGRLYCNQTPSSRQLSMCVNDCQRTPRRCNTRDIVFAADSGEAMLVRKPNTSRIGMNSLIMPKARDAVSRQGSISSRQGGLKLMLKPRTSPNRKHSVDYVKNVPIDAPFSDLYTSRWRLNSLEVLIRWVKVCSHYHNDSVKRWVDNHF